MRPTAQAKKEKLISELIQARKSILAAASLLSPAKQDEVFLGIWSVKDLLVHLIGWDFANLEAAKEILADKLPSFYNHYDHDWQTFNARLVAQYKEGDFAHLVSLVERSHQELIGFLENIPAPEFSKDRRLRFKGWKVTIAALLEVEVNDEKTHCTQIQRFATRRSTASPGE